MNGKKKEQLKALFERAHAEFHRSEERALDPVQFVHRYPKARDQEIVGFFAALLSYGNVQTIIKSVAKVLSPFEKSPFDFFSDPLLKNPWPNFRHRFTTGEDLWLIGNWVHQALKSHGSLESYFSISPSPKKTKMKELLSSFVTRLSNQTLPVSAEKFRLERQRSIKYLLSDPQRGSACKRLNMYLRWMVRPNDGIDLGIWKSVSPEILMLPVDTHLLQTLRGLNWTKSKQASWEVVELATKRLRTFSPTDPIRYDFSLCHMSMRGKNIRSYLEARSLK